MFKKILLNTGFYLETSGTTGKKKKIFHSPERLKASNKAGVDSQQLTSKSKVLTVCSLKHAGGTTAQSLPAISVGAEVVVKKWRIIWLNSEI